MRVLVSGANGFIGSKLCEVLHGKGYKVRALIFHGENYEHIKPFISEVVEGDIYRPETLGNIGKDIDIVYHLAARVGDYGSKQEFYSSILDGTQNMLKACAGQAKRFLYVSSICACGIGREMKGLNEDAPGLKTGVYYGDAKLEAEQNVKAAAKDFTNGCVIIRPGNVIGPGSIWVRDLINQIQKNVMVLFDQGKHSASLVYVDNLIDGLVLAGEKPEAENQTYFLRDDWEVSWKQYVTDLCEISGKSPLLLKIPFRLAWILGTLAELISRPFGIRPIITRTAAGLMGRNNDVLISKAQTELGWKSSVSYDKAIIQIKHWVAEFFSKP